MASVPMPLEDVEREGDEATSPDITTPTVETFTKEKSNTRSSRRSNTSTPKSSCTASPITSTCSSSSLETMADDQSCVQATSELPKGDDTSQDMAITVSTVPSTSVTDSRPKPVSSAVKASTVPAATPTATTIATTTATADVKSCPVRPGILWAVGSRIEAKDYLGKAQLKQRPDCGPKLKGRKNLEDWYAARIVDVDFTEQSVCVHFDGWSQRFDQWVSMDSDRLRPLTRHSERKEKRKRGGMKPEHKVGDNVFAKWTDCRMYPALIIGVNENGSYEVLFYDGFKKTVQCINIRSMPADVQKQYAQAGLLPEPGKKIRQKVKELMDSVQPPHDAKSSSPDEGSSGTSKVSTSGKEFPKHNKRRLFPTGETVKAKRARTESKEESGSKSGDTSQSKRDNKSRGKDIRGGKRSSTDSTGGRASGTDVSNQSDVSMQENLSQVKTEVEAERSKEDKQKTADSAEPTSPATVIEGSAIKIEDQAPHCSSPAEEASVPDMSDAPIVPPKEVTLFEESLETSQKRRSSSEAPLSTTKDGSAPVVKQELSDSSSPGLAPGARAPKEFTVVDDHNKYKCPFTDCNKGFRKLGLVEYHVKYYHSEDGSKISLPTLPPPRKRKKTTSICSTDSEISVGGGQNTSKTVPGSSRQRHPSLSMVVPPVVEDEATTENLSVHDNSEVETRTNTTEEGEVEFTVVADDDDDRLRTDDVVSCICQINEENGLMIQCDYCLCWQHAVCMDITEDTLPKKYVCYVCCNPPGARESMRFSCDQDWLKQGTMARFDMLLADPTSERKAQIMQATHELVADMHSVRNVLSSTKAQIQAAQTKNSDEVKLWTKNLSPLVESREAQRTDHLNTEPLAFISSTSDSLSVSDNKPPSVNLMQTSRLSGDQPDSDKPSQSINVADSGRIPQPVMDVNRDGEETSREPESSSSSLSHSSLLPSYNADQDSAATGIPAAEAAVENADSAVDEQPPTANADADNANGDNTDADNADGDNADGDNVDGDNAEIDTSGTDTASTMSMMIVSEDEDNRLAEVAGDDDDEDPFSHCEVRLLEHILASQDEADRRLDLIEDQLTLLESEDNVNRQGENILRDLPRVKKALHQLLQDLAKVKRMALYR